MELKCIVCGKELTGLQKMYCSRICKNKSPKTKELIRLYQQKPEAKEQVRLHRQRAEVKEKIRKYSQRYRQRAEVKEKMRLYRQSPKYKEQARLYHQRPEVKERKRLYQQREEVKEKGRLYRQRAEVKTKNKVWNLKNKERQDQLRRIRRKRPEIKIRMREADRRYKKNHPEKIKNDSDRLVLKLQLRRHRIHGLYNHKCARCGFEEVLDIHHINDNGKGDRMYRKNIKEYIVLCPNCHTMVTRGILTKQDILQYQK